jgi:hypothetical protein
MRAGSDEALSPAPFPACGRKRQKEENEGARLAPSCSPSQCKRLIACISGSSLLFRSAWERGHLR